MRSGNRHRRMPGVHRPTHILVDAYSTPGFAGLSPPPCSVPGSIGCSVGAAPDCSP